ncbi:MAG: YHS domain-containing protein [Candidatus Thermoplasmatota archaeon]|jgi:YHS domain-containing protein|nr:YHS domain-containing protein [Candidatus Thermoplasmatota archaeon]MCL5955471.1 YHS domain-containing protein [Candidatus Thermoplasmatota archaeon]
MAKMVDPVCGMTVSDDTGFKSSYKEKEYHFCCVHCKEKFDANPLKFTR